MELVLSVISLLLILSNHEQLSSSDAAPADLRYPYPFMTTDAEKAAEGAYDYIVVGGGAAGCPLAATLSTKYKVLVLERGSSPYGNPDVEDATVFGQALGKADNYTSVAQTFVSEDGVQLARARVLGGGTAINGMYYSRASIEYIRNMGWDEKLVNESFHWVENQIAFEPRNLAPWNFDFLKGLLDLGIHPYNHYTLDHLEGVKVSASIFDQNFKRHTAADLLKKANPENIVVLLNATASGIILKQNTGGLRATGLNFMSGVNGKTYQVLASCEVILAAGSLGSTQLLLLSGIGPSHHLKQFNIPVFLDLPTVGQGIQDNPGAFAVIKSPVSLKSVSIQVSAIINGSQEFLYSGSAVQPINQTTNQYIGRLFQKLAKPLSRGELWLRTKDPRDNPSVRYNYYSHPDDLKKCVEAVKVLSKLLDTKAFQKYRFSSNASGTGGYEFAGPPLPRSNSNDAAMAKFCKDSLGTMWHFHGGCHFGTVVDENYRVKGTENLRIIDGSTFEDGPGTNPQATTLMLGRYMGMKIIQE